MADAPDDLNYDYTPPRVDPMIADLLADTADEQERFEGKGADAEYYAAKKAGEMAAGGVPASKTPL